MEGSRIGRCLKLQALRFPSFISIWTISHHIPGFPRNCQWISVKREISKLLDLPIALVLAKCKRRWMACHALNTTKWETSACTPFRVTPCLASRARSSYHRKPVRTPIVNRNATWTSSFESALILSDSSFWAIGNRTLIAIEGGPVLTIRSVDVRSHIDSICNDNFLPTSTIPSTITSAW